MPIVTTLQDLLSVHPVIHRARAFGFVELEQRNLIRFLGRTRLFTPGELAQWRAPGPRTVGQLMGLNLRVAELLEQIAQDEARLSSARRQEMLSSIFAFLEEAVGLPQSMIRELFTDITWTSGGLREVVAAGGLVALVRRTSLAELQAPARKRLLGLVAKRLTHDLLIHGNSLRFFYQGLPMMRAVLDRDQPGLTDRYIAFASSLQLLMMLYGGAFPDGAAVRAGRVEVGIQGQAFRIRVSGINFPSLFNEIVKGLFEALLHPGMPTAAELGPDEAIFRELTSGPDLEYELQKVAPEASFRIHQAVAACYDHDPEAMRLALGKAGYDDLQRQGRVAMLYRAYARLAPARTQAFACRAIGSPVSEILVGPYARNLFAHMED
jgi:hypothetical protein